MAGIYVHIPFCKSRCIYCDFFSTTALSKRSRYVDAVCRELSDRRSYLPEGVVDTIYFGGGTPSQLPPDDIERLLRAIYNIYNVRENAEVTLEANPDDLTPSLLQRLRGMGVNRLSVGNQTFDDHRLRFLHRRHTAQQTRQAILDARAAGFANISIDLMYGFPAQTLDAWRTDVDEALRLGVQHISAYALMYEQGTCLTRMLERGDIEEVPDELSLLMYEHLIDALAAVGYEHYEISNFALPGFRSRHNSSYWSGVPYLGVGAGAHSYDGQDRHYNADSLDGYLGGEPLVAERLTELERYNECVFTSLRTSDGLSLSHLRQRFGQQLYDDCLSAAQPHVDDGTLCLDDTGDRLRLTRRGLFISNLVMSDLMVVSD